jgi:hypothetical protein
MPAVIWVALPVLVAAGSALLTFYIMQARLEVALSEEREVASEARVRLESQKKTMEEAIRATEESAKRRALDNFLADVHIEERHYVREKKKLFTARKSVVLQERLYFRNIPLSNWVERELLVEEGANLENTIKRLSVFGPRMLGSGEASGSKLLG